MYEYFEKSAVVKRNLSIFVKAAVRKVNSGTASLSGKLSQQYRKRLSAGSNITDAVVNIGKDNPKRHVATRNPVEVHRSCECTPVRK